MAVWMELHCDRKAEARFVSGAPGKTFGYWEGCSSDRNENPGVMVKSFASIPAGRSALERSARQIGWRRVRTEDGYRWHCPYCKDR